MWFECLNVADTDLLSAALLACDWFEISECLNVADTDLLSAALLACDWFEISECCTVSLTFVLGRRRCDWFIGMWR